MTQILGVLPPIAEDAWIHHTHRPFPMVAQAGADFGPYLGEIYFFLFIKGIDGAQNVEVIAVLGKGRL
ncbi:MAG: hypothetical protein V6Z81_00435 [Parvularculales bacterium]